MILTKFRKFISVLLALIIIFNTVIFGAVYLIVKTKLKAEFIERLNPAENNIVAIDCSKDYDGKQIEFLDNKEIKIGNEFYDIIKTEIRDFRKIIYCIKDSEEEILEKAFLEFLQNAMSTKQKSPVKTIFKNFQINAFAFNYFSEHKIPEFRINFNNIKTALTKSYIQILTPPPKQEFFI